ncbi:MAG TPA: response regulator transcription factor [Vicinamibacteria bacterium]|nr:response regulator transcription factor [Vicinamibacteria bacterium]
MNDRLRVVLVDDHELVRQGVGALLQPEADLEVVGQAGDGLAALELVERLRPDVVVADLMLPGLGGLELTRQVVRRSPGTRVVVLSMHAEEPFVLKALDEGASAYVLKDSGIAELLRAIREAVRGRRYLSPPLSDKAVSAYLRRKNTPGTPDDPYEGLTPRERQVLHLAAEGLGNTALAGRLGISVRTAETHRARLMHKLALRNQTELVRWAIRRGIVPLERDGPRPSEE